MMWSAYFVVQKIAAEARPYREQYQENEKGDWEGNHGQHFTHRRKSSAVFRRMNNRVPDLL